MGCFSLSQAQPSTDTLRKTLLLPAVRIDASAAYPEIQDVPEVFGTTLYATRKSHWLNVKAVQANITVNPTRQLFAKIPGVHVWESDNGMVQTGIATRGLSPNRSWDLQVRQDGFDIAADPFGYPEAYYQPPPMALERIEWVRGQGSLAFGPQFGGMLNYVVKDGSGAQGPVETEMAQTCGSYGQYGLYLALAGKGKRYHYYALGDFRKGVGWRTHGAFQTGTGLARFSWLPGSGWTIRMEYTRARQLYQQPGGLTDSAFALDPRASNRARNGMQIDWNLWGVTLEKNLGRDAFWETRVFALVGRRNSIGFLAPASVPDTLTYTNRNLQKDRYKNWGWESRIRWTVRLFGQPQVMNAGIRHFMGDTRRLADGVGAPGREISFLSYGDFRQDYQLRSVNGALFFETLLRITARMRLLAGVRAEGLLGSVAGQSGVRPDGSVSMITETSRRRMVWLAGGGLTYQSRTLGEWYVNLSKAYRPILFAQLIAQPGLDLVDPNLRDSRGFNADLGLKGQRGRFQYDISLFWLQYNDRVGVLPASVSGLPYRLITNVADSRSRGLELYTQTEWLRYVHPKHGMIRATGFVSYAYTDARYGKTILLSQAASRSVENAPAHLLRLGAQCEGRGFTFSVQVSHTSDAFSDAANTTTPDKQGLLGRIPSYTLTDLQLQKKWGKCALTAGVTNLFAVSYFTRRAGSYPGPGLIPGNGRTFVMSLIKTL